MMKMIVDISENGNNKLHIQYSVVHFYYDLISL